MNKIAFSYYLQECILARLGIHLCEGLQCSD